MASQADDDLIASKTEGYKAGEKKTVEEYAKLGLSESAHFTVFPFFTSGRPLPLQFLESLVSNFLDRSER